MTRCHTRWARCHTRWARCHAGWARCVRCYGRRWGRRCWRGRRGGGAGSGRAACAKEGARAADQAHGGHAPSLSRAHAALAVHASGSCAPLRLARAQHQLQCAAATRGRGGTTARLGRQRRGSRAPRTEGKHGAPQRRCGHALVLGCCCCRWHWALRPVVTAAVALRRLATRAISVAAAGQCEVAVAVVVAAVAAAALASRTAGSGLGLAWLGLA